MKPTTFFEDQQGLVGSSDLMRTRAGRPRFVVPPEPVISVEFGDVASAVDAGWPVWRASLGTESPRAA